MNELEYYLLGIIIGGILGYYLRIVSVLMGKKYKLMIKKDNR